MNKAVGSEKCAIKIGWVPLKGWDGVYEIHPFGGVRSVDRTIACRNGEEQNWSGRVLSPWINKTGYFCVHLRHGSSRKRAARLLHRLLAIQFIPNPDGKPCINHIDHDRRNNALANLEWCTQTENLQHARDAGRLRTDQLGGRGEAAPNAKLTDEAVIDILRLRGLGWTYKQLAARHDVTKENIAKVATGKTWTHIDCENARLDAEKEKARNG